MGERIVVSKNKLDLLVDEALDNIRNDRKLAREFLNEIANQIATDAEQNKYLSPVAAKHIETLQRSNEQLVKLIGVRQKDKSQKSMELSEDDKNNLFDIINPKTLSPKNSNFSLFSYLLKLLCIKLFNNSALSLNLIFKFFSIFLI